MTRNPKDLSPHPLIRRFPRWKRGTDEWTAFVGDIKSHAIQHPLLITTDDLVVDGETRRLAAIAAGLDQVPVRQVANEEIPTIVLRELLLRRNLTKSQLAYCAAPILIAAFKEGCLARDNMLRSGGRLPTLPDTAESYALQLGLSPRLIAQSAELRRKFDEHQHDLFLFSSADTAANLAKWGLDPKERHSLKDYFERAVFDEDHPISLGGALAGVGFMLDRARKDGLGCPPHTGARPRGADRQLKLFAEGWTTLGQRYDYWQKFDAEHKAEAAKAVRASVAAMPDDLLDELRRATTTEWRKRTAYDTKEN